MDAIFSREEKIKKSGVREVFIPNKPIDSINLFCGRQNEVAKIIESLNTTGNHILLYGDRGVGKTSLSTIACAILTSERYISNYYIKRCDSSDTFSSIALHLLDELGIECIIKKNKSWDFSFLWNFIRFNKGGNKEVVSSDNLNSPSWVARRVNNISGVFLIDEIDVLSNFEDKKKIAELIKNLSDCNSGLTIFIVGISKTASELIGGHPSIQRCLKDIKLSRMTNSELADIITKGEERLGLKFERDVKKIIVRSSAGFPHFAQLLSLKCAEEVITKDISTVTMDDYKIAVKRAMDDIEGGLKDTYNMVIYGQKMERNKNILLAAALCGEDVFNTNQLKGYYKELTKTELSVNELNNFLSPSIISNGFSTILRREGKGVYIFNDPRMPSFIKLISNHID